MYLDVCLEFKGQEVRHKLLYLHLENLLCFEQVFQALRFQSMSCRRKSGSWEFIHSEESQIMQTIGQAPVESQEDLPETASGYLDLPRGINRLGVRSSQKLQIGVG